MWKYVPYAGLWFQWNTYETEQELVDAVAAVKGYRYLDDDRDEDFGFEI